MCFHVVTACLLLFRSVLSFGISLAMRRAAVAHGPCQSGKLILTCVESSCHACRWNRESAAAVSVFPAKDKQSSFDEQRNGEDATYIPTYYM